MNNVKIRLNRAGVREGILKAEGTASECRKYAEKVYSRVSGTEGYEVAERNYAERRGYAVTAVKGPARKENQENNTLQKALHG